MEDKSPGLTENLVLWGSIVLAWVSGEAGRIFVAGGAGGLTRWLISEKKTVRNGAIQVTSGAVAAHYLWPWMHAMMTAIFGPMGETADAKVTAGYVAGLVGISAAKIIIAVVEARAKKLEEPDNG
ncbi:MAG: hypothetical protein MUD11_13460 [Rhodobacteraceae bacterium]|jgi:hypothetical protein|nr:hypothetical protein [Paracoccaceae bacterium]